MKAFFTYDGRLARSLLAAFQFFIVSVQFLATALPAILFDRLVGWQPTHGAIWLGVLSTVSIGPGAVAALSSMRAFVLEGGYPGRPFRTFWTGFSTAITRLWWFWTGLAVLEVLLAYNLALYGALDAVFIGAVLVGALLLVACVSMSCALLAGASGRPLLMLASAMRAAIVRPQAPAAWILLVAIGCGSTLVPVIGPNLALFAPGVCAWAILIVNDAVGFDRAVSDASTAAAS
jgi:hypothetical protein